MTSLCRVCSAPAAHRCAGCQQVAYCGRDHQRTDWKAQHRDQCRRFKVVRNDRLGRHLVATRHIKQGEIIYRDEPYAVGPKIANVPLCLGCNRNLMPLLQQTGADHFHECTRCGWPLCGPSCEESAQHRPECAVLAASGYRPNIRPHRANPEHRESAYCVIVPLRVLLLERTAPERYATVQGYESHLAERLASPLYGVLRTNLVPFVRTVLGLQQYSEQTVLQLSAILDTNCYEIRLPEQHVKVRGLYPLGAMLSHDCRPNTKHYFDDRLHMVLVATVDIPEGAVIHASYTQPLLGTVQRRLALRQAKCFDCACNRCTDPTEHGTDASGFRCPNCRRTPALVLAVEPTNYRTVWRCQNRRCSYQERPEQYVARCEQLQQELLALDRTDPAGYESFLARHEPTLHRWNAYILQAKYALTQLLSSGRSANRTTQGPTEASSRRTIELCRDLLAVADRLEPGHGTFRTKLLLELGTALGALHSLGVLSDPERQDWCTVRTELERIAKTDPTVDVSSFGRTKHSTRTNFKMFKNHLAMIGMNETPNKKAKFWQSYIRSLKGSDDIRAHDTPAYRRPILLFDEPDTAVGRINSPGYHYLPVHRETYGYSPRPIYDHHYTRSQRAPSVNRLADAEKAWADHLERMRDIDRRYPSRYGLYLKDKPSQVVFPQEMEYEPETKPLYSTLH